MSTGDQEREPELVELAQRLERERPLPRPAFRGDLGRRLSVLAGSGYSRPARLRLWIGANASGGVGLLALAAVGVLGIGPLAA